jgi:hypothetical protein
MHRAVEELAELAMVLVVRVERERDRAPVAMGRVVQAAEPQLSAIRC